MFRRYLHHLQETVAISSLKLSRHLGHTCLQQKLHKNTIKNKTVCNKSFCCKHLCTNSGRGLWHRWLRPLKMVEPAPEHTGVLTLHTLYWRAFCLKINTEGEVPPRIGPESPKGGSRYRSTVSWRRMGLVANVTLRPLYAREWNPVPTVLRAGWVRGPVRT